jgi:hypothetical protein
MYQNIISYLNIVFPICFLVIVIILFYYIVCGYNLYIILFLGGFIMSNVFEIKKDIYYAGVIDKNLEVFDIIMKTEFGTTYNSYLIKD